MTDLGSMIHALSTSADLDDSDSAITFSLARFYAERGKLTRPMEVVAYSLLADYDRDLSGIERPVDDDGDVVTITTQVATPTEVRRRSDVSFRCGVVEGHQAIIAKTPFSLKELCKAVPGRKFSGVDKAWWWPKGPIAAMALRDAFASYSPTWDDEFASLLGELDKAAEHKVATDLPDIDSVKTTAWMHQRQAYNFARELKVAALHMDMGTGKSLVAVARAMDIGGDILIVCPDKVVPVWPREFRHHAHTPVHAETGRRHKKRGLGFSKLSVKERTAAFTEMRDCTCGLPHIYLVNYEILATEPLKSFLANRHWDLVVYDEAHRLKSPQGTTSKSAALVSAKADHVLELTGTPMPHSPLDIFGQYRALDKSIFGSSFTTFRARYAIMGGFQGKNVVGMNPATIDELHAKVYQVAFRVRAEDVLDLPPVMDQYLSTTMDGAQAKAYESMLNEMTAEFPGLSVSEMATRAVQGETLAQNALVKLLRLRQITGGSLKDDASGETLMLGDAKEKLLAEWMEDFPKDEPLAVFAEFTADIATIRRVAEKQGRTHGEVSGQRNDLNEDGEFPEHLDVLAVQIASGGTGVDLTRAAYAAYYSVGYNNGNYEQSRKRLHRPGQTRPVRFTHLLCEETIDETVYETLQGRSDMTSSVQDR